MARNTGGNRGDVRKSALWGSGNRGGEFRSNALWGKGGRGSVVTLVGVLVLSLAAGAASARGTAPEPARGVNATVVEPGLLEKAQANPKQKFKIIVQSAAGAKAAETAFGTVESQDDQQLVKDEATADKNERAANEAASGKKSKSEQSRYKAERERWKAEKENAKDLRRTARGQLADRFEFIGGVSLEMSGRRLQKLAKVPGLIITEDVEVVFLDCGSDEHAFVEAAVGPRDGRQRILVRDSPPDACDRDRGLRHRHVPAQLRRAERQAAQLRQFGQCKPRERRRSRSRQLRRRHRCRLGEGLRRCGSECSAGLARRHGRLRLRPDE